MVGAHIHSEISKHLRRGCSLEGSHTSQCCNAEESGKNVMMMEAVSEQPISKKDLVFLATLAMLYLLLVTESLPSVLGQFKTMEVGATQAGHIDHPDCHQY